jgi:hypothetical protein
MRVTGQKGKGETVTGEIWSDKKRLDKKRGDREKKK